ncbi:MAG: two-component system invasion response regulator UvrY [Candidatus Azotimanducaceae bacterium]|jgi:two-component system invasion response regulator UvrY
MIRVLVVDDHKLVRTGTCRLLADEVGIEIIGQASSGEEAILAVREEQPDVVLMDVNMPGIGGLEATRRCLRVDPELKVIIVTIYDQEPYPSQLMSIGAAGYLTKCADVQEMVRAIRKVVSGQRYLTDAIAQQLALRPFNSGDGCPFEMLSSREMQIAIMVTGGQAVTDISKSLSLSPKTVNSYRYRIFDKLGVRNDVALTKLAIKHRIIDSGIAA